MKKILAIDDQLDNLITIKAVIMNNINNCQVITAMSGKEGLQMATSEEPDTILLDIIMPEMDGFEVCRRLKENKLTSHIPVIMITAIKTDSRSRIKGLELGADAFLSKPIEAAEFTAQVNVMLRIKEAEDKLRSDKVQLEHQVEERTQELKNSEEKYRALYENAPLPYQSLDVNGFLRDVNPAWLSILGYERKEVIGASYEDFLHPEWKPKFRKRFPEFKKLGYVHHVMHKIRHKKGHYLDIDFEGCAAYNPDGSFKQTYCVFQDVTESIKIRKALEESERKINTLINNLLGFAYRCNNDEQWSMTYLSSGFERITGYAITDVVNNNKLAFADLILETDREIVWKEIQESLQHKKSFQVNYQIRKADNTIGFVLEQGVGIIDEKGEVLALEGYVADITELKTAEKALKESEAYMRTVFEAANNVSFITSGMDKNDGTILSFSRGAELIFGYKAEEIIGQSIAILHEEGYEKEVPLIKESINQGKQHKSREITLVRKSGEKFPAILSVHPLIDDEGQQFGLLGVSVDITQLKRAENALKESEEMNRSITQSANDGMVSINADGLIMSWNMAAERIFGFKAASMIGRNLSDVIPKESLESNGQELRLLLSDKKDEVVGKTFEIMSRRKDGLKFPIELSISGWQANNQKYYTSIIRDISVRKSNEEQINKLSTAVEQSPSIIVITDLEGTIQYVNPKFTELTGYSKEEVIGNNARILKSGLQGDTFYNTFWETIKAGATWQGNFHNMRKDGSLFWESASISPITDANGQRTNYIKVSEDITERLEAEQALKASQEQYSKLIGTTSEGFWLIDTDAIILDVNDSLCHMLGYTREEIIGKRSFDFVDDKNKKVFVSQLSKAKRRTQRSYEIFLKHKDGHNIPTVFNATSISDEKDEYSGSFAFVTNNTDRYEAHLIQEVLYQISNAVLTTNNLETLLGMVQKVLGKIIDTTNFYIALYDKNKDSLSLPFFTDEMDMLSAIPNGKTLTHLVFKTQKPLLATAGKREELIGEGLIERFGSDAKVWLGVPLRVENEITGVLAVQSYSNENAFTNKDLKVLEFISDQVGMSIHRKRTEENIIKALNKAEESDRLKSAFLANMSHEIRTPMNGILGFSDLLKEPGLSGEEIQEYIRIIEKSGHRMLNTINDLMDISKIEAGQMDVTYSEVDVVVQLNELSAFFKPFAEKKNIDLILSNNLDQKDSKIETDRDKLYAVLSNLMNNAFKYTHEGSIELGCQRKGDMLEFSVKDTGIGIPGDRIDAIFERFVQADIEDKEVYEGTGLGLSISKAFIEMLGGSIGVSSELGVGSRFYFSIPFIVGSTEAQSSELPETDTQKKPLELHILIAEDDETTFEYLEIVLEDIAEKIFHARNGKEAVKFCKENPQLDLVLMDIKMPEMNGYVATREIRKFNRKIPIVAQTAFALVGDSDKALEAGCNDYISKPIDRIELMKLIQQLMHH